MKKGFFLVFWGVNVGMAHAAPCDAYVACVCDWAQELSQKSNNTQKSEPCEKIRTMYKGADSEKQSVCKQALSMFKEVIKEQKTAYNTVGFSIPESCK